MRRCDFYSVMKIITNYIGEGRSVSQLDLIYNLFERFANEAEDYDFDNGQINRWIKGVAPVSPRIVSFYLNDKSAEYLSVNIEDNILPLLYDCAKASEEIYNLVIGDLSISEQKKDALTASFPCSDGSDIANFMASVVLFATERKFEKHDLKQLTAGTLSPIADDMIFDGAVPKPCKHFCGREKELDEMHTSLKNHNKVFVNGIAGIGKSEFVKAYAAAHKKEYTNILYFTYSDSLQEMISDMDFADDQPDDDNTARFKKHNRFLRSLKDDTLIIIDNFNTTAAKESVLDVVMKYNCRVIFTTRSRFEIGHTFELSEITDTETLITLFGKFYSDTETEREIVIGIIETVHKHTLSVELSARLLQKGMLEPRKVLEKLSECAVNPEATDKIGITKDGISSKATYYSHLHTLFSLSALDEGLQSVMRCMSFVPDDGIRARLFAGWLGLTEMDAINDLIELGYIGSAEAGRIKLCPMVREIAVADLKPSITSCKTLINSVQQICLRHGEDVSFRKSLLSVIENIIARIEKDDIATYIRFIEDAFSYMEKYKYESGMRLVTSEMGCYRNGLSANDTALLYDFQSALESMFGKSLKNRLSWQKGLLKPVFPKKTYTLPLTLI